MKKNISQNKRIFLNIIATYFRSIVVLFCGIFTSRWILQVLGAENYGLYGLIGGFAFFITFINNLFAGSISRFYAFSIGKSLVNKDSGLEDCQKWFNTAILIHSIIPILLISIGYPIGTYAIKHWLTIPQDRIIDCIWMFRFVCLSCFVSMINVPFYAMFLAKQYICEVTIYTMAQLLVNLGFIYYMLIHPGEWLVKYSLYHMLCTITPQIIICFRARQIFPECKINLSYIYSKSRIKQLASFAFWQAFYNIGVIIRSQGLQILINKSFCPSANAAMTFANTVSSQSQTFSSAIQTAFQPAITTACGAENYELMRKLTYRTCKFMTIISVIFALPVMLEIDYILKVWLVNPPSYTNILCIFILISTVIDKYSLGFSIAVYAKGKIAALQVFTGTLAFMTLPVAYIFTRFGIGIKSIGIAYLVCTIALTFGRAWLARRLVGTSSIYWFKKLVLPITISILVCLALGYAIKLHFAPSFYRLCIITLICELIFIPSSWIFSLDREERIFIIEKIKTKLLRKL